MTRYNSQNYIPHNFNKNLFLKLVRNYFSNNCVLLHCKKYSVSFQLNHTKSNLIFLAVKIPYRIHSTLKSIEYNDVQFPQSKITNILWEINYQNRTIYWIPTG